MCFFRRFWNIPDSGLSLFSLGVSVCTHTRQVESQALQQNWQSSENSPNFKEKTQYLVNTLYVHIQFNITFRDDVIHFDDRLVDLCIKMNYLSCNYSKKNAAFIFIVIQIYACYKSANWIYCWEAILFIVLCLNYIICITYMYMVFIKNLVFLQKYNFNDMIWQYNYNMNYCRIVKIGGFLLLS